LAGGKITVLICPYDMSWCQRGECHIGFCGRAADDPLAPCEDCGALVVRAAAHGICIDCIEITVIDQQQGG